MIRRLLDRLARVLAPELARAADAHATCEWTRDATRARDRAEHELAQLQARVQAFEAASGVQLDDWRGRNVGAAVRLVLDGGT